jgi:uncharacterized protein
MQRSPSLFLTALSWVLLSCACNRTEEPAAPTIAETATPAAAAAGGSAGSSTLAMTPQAPGASTATGSAPTASPVCTVPLGDPAPIATKATQCPKDPTGNLKLPLGKIIFSEAPGAPQVEVELARDDASRERGLMYRTSMPAGRGMLFSWQDERVRNFWMHNTCIPLDMLYVTKDGLIAGILEQVPTLNDAPRGIKCPVAHVLELNAGWARAHGIKPGMKLKIEG